MEPLKEDKNKTKLTFMLETDMKGAIPTPLLRQGNKDQGMQVHRLRQVLADYVKDKNIKW
jgi:hypothetical protein